MADPNSELARYLQARPPNQHAILLGPEHHLALYQELFLIEFPDRIADELDVAHALPLRFPLNAPLTLVLGPTQATQVAYIRSLYPDAVASEVRHPNGALFFRAVDLTPEDARRRSGLTLSAAPGGAVAGVLDPFAAVPAGVAPGARLVWTGQIYWPSERALGVHVRAAGPTTVQIGDAPPLRAEGGERGVNATLTLPRGWQRIRIEDSNAPGRALGITISGDGHGQNVHPAMLRPESERQGLAATYTVGNETIEMLDPQVNAFVIEQRLRDGRVRTPFRAVWRGALRVDRAGTYGFDAVASGPFRVGLDSQPLLGADAVVPEQPVEPKTERALEPGLHPLEVTFDSPQLSHTTRRIFQLFWTPPGGERQLIPPTNLVPPE